MKQGEAVYVLN